MVEAGLTVDLTEQLDQLLSLHGGQLTADLPLLQGPLPAFGGVAFEGFKQADTSDNFTVFTTKEPWITRVKVPNFTEV